MVKEIKKYYCIKCGRLYPRKETAENCENLPILNLFNKRDLFKCGFFIENDIENSIENDGWYVIDDSRKIDYEKLNYDLNKISKKRRKIFSKMLRELMEENKKLLKQSNINLNNSFEKIIKDFKKSQVYKRYKDEYYTEKDKLIGEVITSQLKTSKRFIFSFIPTKISHPRSLGEVYVTFIPFKEHKSLEERIPGYFSYISDYSEEIGKYHTQTYNPLFIFTSNMPIKNYNKEVLLFNPHEDDKYSTYKFIKNDDDNIIVSNSKIAHSISHEKDDAYLRKYLKGLLNVSEKEIPLQRVKADNIAYKNIATLLERIKIWPNKI